VQVVTINTASSLAKKKQGAVRIIAGQWRGRKLSVADVPDLRPTSDRIRETLFNWLQFEWEGARWLDLFSGSGALAFEALSRGAAQVVMIEKNATALRQLHENKKRLSATGAHIVSADSFAWLVENQGNMPPFDGVFLDPPFRDERIELILSQLVDLGYLKSKAWLYIEQPKDRVLSLAQFEPYRQQTSGAVAYGLWQVRE
jgi:16S rRNA (guanine966-N2)-methyltransferase